MKGMCVCVRVCACARVCVSACVFRVSTPLATLTGLQTQGGLQKQNSCVTDSSLQYSILISSREPGDFCTASSSIPLQNLHTFGLSTLLTCAQKEWSLVSPGPGSNSTGWVGAPLNSDPRSRRAPPPLHCGAAPVRTHTAPRRVASPRERR